ncbi:MAG: CBS domain-containing protein [Saprospiraceae bacterium]|nr:CBS domain-containing protein [Saprospiraceae bacterium]
MNILAPVSSIMTKKVIAIGPEDELAMVKDIFAQHNIHHLPVVRHDTLVGMVSKTDFDVYYKTLNRHFDDNFVNDTLLKVHRVKEIMTSKLAKVEPDDRINVVLEVFKVNRFHALPVVQDDELVGIVTTYDIINALSNETIHDSDYKV